MTKPLAVQYVQWDTIPVETVNPLFDRQFVVGDQVMVARISMKKGCLVPNHSHHNEQISYILEGKLKVIAKKGESLKDSALALEDTLAIDTFTPPREDWINGTDQYLRK